MLSWRAVCRSPFRRPTVRPRSITSLFFSQSIVLFFASLLFCSYRCSYSIPIALVTCASLSQPHISSCLWLYILPLPCPTSSAPPIGLSAPSAIVFIDNCCDASLQLNPTPLFFLEENSSVHLFLFSLVAVHPNPLALCTLRSHLNYSPTGCIHRKRRGKQC